VNLPIWDIAVQTEGKASLRVKSYAPIVAGDEWLRRAVELNAFEEGRHKHVFANLVRAYGIELAPEPDYVAPRDVEWAFMVTASANASTASSPSVCSNWPSVPASSPPNWSRPSSR
jgi:hypothetical protein